MNYSEKLKSPKWQKKRLEILQRDKFKCRACENEKETLNIHHISYDKNKEPWDYDNDNLITLCDECHKTWHNIYDNYYSEYVSAVVRLYDDLEYESIKKFAPKNK